MSNTKPIREYDTNGKLIYYNSNSGYEEWWEFDFSGNLIHYKSSIGYEFWREYDSNGNEIHYKNSRGIERWYWEGKLTEDPVKILLLATQIHFNKKSLLHAT